MKKILTTLIATTALLTVSAPASSAEITGCLDVRGTLTKVAPGVQPMRPCGPQAKKVRIPVASGAGKPGSARVDSYTFFTEITRPNEWVDAFLLRPVYISGLCSERNGTNVASVVIGSNILLTMVDSAEGHHDPESDAHTDLAEMSVPPPNLGTNLGAGVKVVHLLGSHVRAKIEVAATVNGERPALCTFSGTVDIIRAR